MNEDAQRYLNSFVDSMKSPSLEPIAAKPNPPELLDERMLGSRQAIASRVRAPVLESTATNKQLAPALMRR